MINQGFDETCQVWDIELAKSFGATHLFSDSATAFYDKYGKNAFWELINKPFVQQEIIDQGKTVLLATPYDTIIDEIPDIFLTRREIALLDNARYTRIKTPIGDALVHTPY